MRRAFAMLMAVAGLALVSSPAEAHTRASGFIPLPNGDVEFYIGTYDHGGGLPPLQGSLDIIAGPVTGSFAFTSVLAFTSPAAIGLTSPGATYGENTSSGPIVHFQNVTVSGLVSGIYTIDLSGLPSNFWFTANSSVLPITIPVSVTNVPEPTSMAMFGLTALGMGFAARRRRRQPDRRHS